MVKQKEKKEATVLRVEAGEHVCLSEAALNEGKTEEVFPKCDVNRGFWACTTHHETFQRQINKDFHIGGKGVHRLAWICLPCGRVEVP